MYIIFLFILFFNCLKYKFHNKLIIYISFIFLYVSLDSFVGTDSEMYFKNYNNLTTQITLYLYRSGYFLDLFFINLKRIGFNFLGAKILITLLFITMLFLIIRKIVNTKIDENKMLLLLFANGFILQNSLNVIKQGISIMIIYLALLYFKQKKLKFILLNLIAILFHSSSIIFLLIYFISNKIKLSTKKYFLLFIISLLLGNFLDTIFISLLSKLDLKYYISYFEKGKANLSYNWFNYLEFQIPAIILFVSEFKKKTNSINKSFKNLFYIEIIIINLIIPYKQLISRITSFFVIINVLVYVFLVNKIKNKYIRILILGVISIIYFYVRVFKIESLAYKTWL